MKLANLLILSSSLIFLLCACSNTATVKVKGENGFTEEYIIDKESKLKNGPYKKLDEKGTLMEETNYIDDKIDGLRKIYYKNGNVEIEENYKAGEFDGELKSYYDSGELQLEGNYVKGQMLGKWKGYYKSGKLKEVVTFKDNAENGPFIEYYENGNMKAEGSYLNGDNEHGPLVIYKEDGSVERKMDCVEGRCTTTWSSETKNEE